MNFPDVLLSHGKYQFKPPPPFIPGAEAAGVVKAIGQGVTACAGKLRPHVDQALPFARGGEALTRLAKREVMGKIVLVP